MMGEGSALDLSLYLVLDPDLCGGPDGMVSTAQVAAENGATVIQLRAPNWKKRQWLETARELKAVLAPLGGMVRGLLHDGLSVTEGFKIGDIDPRGAKADYLSISDKARAVAGGVLEAMPSLDRKRPL